MGTMTNFYPPDTGYGQETYSRNTPGYIDSRSLGANSNESVTVPAGAVSVLFSSTGNFYAENGGTAAIPGDVSDGTASELNPAGWYVKEIGAIGLIAPSACVVTLTFYK